MKALKLFSTSENTLTPSVNYYGGKVTLRFSGSVLQQKPVTYSYKKVVNLYVVQEITNFHSIDSYPTLTNGLFGAVKLTKKAGIDRYRYSGYGIGFDGKRFYSRPSDGTERNIIIFGEGPTQGLGEHSLSVEKMYSINFTNVNTKYCLSLHYNVANSYLFVNGTEIHKFTAKDPEVVPNNLCLGNASKDF